MNKIRSWFPSFLIVTGVIGFFFSFLITTEKFKLIEDPSHIPPCSINPFFSCSSVMQTPQASAFGFPNPLIGIAGFAIILTIAFSLKNGIEYKRWFWRWVQAGVTFALAFIYWLAYQSIYEIAALCLYCMAVWAITIPLFNYVTLFNVKEGHIPIAQNQLAKQALLKYHWLSLIILYSIILLPLTYKFWPYWSSLFL